MSNSVQVMQKMRVNRACLLGVALLIYMLVCGLAFVLGFMEISVAQFVILCAIASIGFLGFISLIYLELNLSFNDPDLSLPQLMWALTLVLGCAWLATDMKPLIALTGISLILMATNRLDDKKLLIFIVFSISMYIFMLGVEFITQPANVDWFSEVLTLIAYSFIISCGSALIRYEKSVLQGELVDKNRKLTEALEKVNSLAIRDELTGSFNRRHLDEVLRHQKALADRQNYSFSICFIDLDQFKRVNDLFGYHAGDIVLQDFVKLVESILKDVDCLARIGGEEFVLVLGGTTDKGAQVFVNRIKSLLQTQQINSLESDYRITISVGVTQYRPQEEIDEMIKRAALCLSRAKRSGRDRVITSEMELESSVGG